MAPKIWPPKPIPNWKATNQLAQATNGVATGTNVAAISANTNAVAPIVPGPLPSGPEDLVVLSNSLARYTFTSRGGGFKTVELLNFPESVDCHSKSPQTNLATLNTATSLPLLAVGGSDALVGDAAFKVERTASGVRAQKILPGGLVLEKDFALASNYLVYATVRISNSTAQPIALPAQEYSVGTATPMGPLDNEQNVGVFWYNGAKEQQWAGRSGMSCVGGTAPTTYSGGNNDVVWAAVHNQFFVVALMPAQPATQVIANRVDLPPPSREVMAANPKATAKPFGFQTGVFYSGTNLPANAAIERKFIIYAGPKENRRLELIAAEQKNNLEALMGYSGFIGWFARALLAAMNGLHALVPSYAFAIIAITVIIKMLFWPLTAASTRSMKRMQALQPQMKALQDKYKDDPAKMNAKLMQFMKENKVSPLGGCLPMLLQIPVFFGFYRMIQSAIELRGAQFLWVCDLSRPDTLFVLPGLNVPVNPLPLIMGVTMLWQARLTPASPGMDPAQQKIMRYMPLMFLFILYNFSAGLTLYWTVQNLLTIAQMKLTRTKDAKSSPGTAGAAPVAGPPKRRR